MYTRSEPEGGRARSRHVWVFNQYAAPQGRHADLFSKIPGWSATIVIANRQHQSNNTWVDLERIFLPVRILRYKHNGTRRIIGFMQYFLGAVWHGIRAKHLDVAYGSTPHPLAAAAARIVATVRNKPFILEVRDLWPESLVSAETIARGGLVHRGLSRLEKSLARAADEIVVVTPGWEAHFRDLGLPQKRLTVVSNGVDVDRFRAIDRTQSRTQHGIHGFTAVFAGTHGPKDGLDYILDAALVLPHVNIILVGQGTDRARIIQRARDLNLANVDFRPYMRKAELAGLISACDVGIHAVTPFPVFEKGMSPNKLFEYMGAGIPIVSNAGHALRHIIRDGQCGPLGDADDLAECLQAVFDADRTTRAQWGMESRRLVAEYYDRRHGVRTLEGLLNSVSKR